MLLKTCKSGWGVVDLRATNNAIKVMQDKKITELTVKEFSQMIADAVIEGLDIALGPPIKQPVAAHELDASFLPDADLGQGKVCPVDYMPRDKRRFYDDLPEFSYFSTATALKIGRLHGIKQRAVKEMLSKGSAKGQEQIFERIKHGIYIKKH